MAEVRIIRRQEVTNEYGEKVPTWVPDTSTHSAVLAPGNTDEQFNPTTDSTTETCTLHFRGKNLQVNAKDRVEIDGVVWEVQGARAFYENPFAKTVATSITVARNER